MINFKLFQTERVADNNYKFDDHGRKFSRRVENTVGKTKLLFMNNFSFFHSVFSRRVLQTHENKGLFGKGLTLYLVVQTCNDLDSQLFTTQSRLLMTQMEEAFENILGKGEIAGNQYFLLFPKCYLSFQKQISISKLHLFYCLQKLLIWTMQSKILSCDEERRFRRTKVEKAPVTIIFSLSH